MYVNSFSEYGVQTPYSLHGHSAIVNDQSIR